MRAIFGWYSEASASRSKDPSHELEPPWDAITVGAQLARKVFAKRGNHSEIHLTEAELTALLAIAAEKAASKAAVTK